jgi:hypothetical protein
MAAEMSRRKVPEINLLARQREATTVRAPRLMEAALLTFVVAVWSAVGVTVAVLLGWHP